MNRRQEHIVLTLLHYAASKLAEQYNGRAEHSKFRELIAALEGKETDAIEESQEHEQGKIAPPPEE